MGGTTYFLKNTHPFLNTLEKNGLTFNKRQPNAYFVHSYSCKPEDKKHVILSTDYSEEISAMVAKENILGTQFHPEKNHTFGLNFLKSFLSWNPE